MYIGTSEFEKYLLHTLKDKITKNPDIFVKILVDFNRAGRSQTEVIGDTMPRTLLDDLKTVTTYNNNVAIGLMKTEQNKNMLRPLSPGILELLSVMHMKGAVFDDHVVLTGANLSEDYFVDRQDRYWIFNDCKDLADYFEDIVGTYIGNSVQVQSDGDNKLRSQNLYKKKGFRESLEKQMRILKFANRFDQKQKDSITD